MPDVEGGTGTFSPTPAGVSFVTLYTQVSNYVGGPSDAEVVAISKEGVWDGIRRMNAHRWHWSRIKQDVTFTASQQEYSLGASYKEIRALELLDANAKVNGGLRFVDPKSWDEFLPQRINSPGTPIAATIFNEYDNGLITLDKSPSTGFLTTFPTLRLRFWRQIPLPTGDNSLAEIPSFVEPFVKWHGRMVVAAHWDPTKVSFAERQADKHWMDIRRENTIYGTAAWTAEL